LTTGVLPALSKNVINVNKGSLVLELLIDLFAWSRNVRRIRGINV
jgi:hypothetical protein